MKREQDLKEEIASKKKNVGKLTPKLMRKDGFGNKQLRSLTIAAYLRCLLAAIEYAPSDNNVSLRALAIEKIREPNMFRTITQLCDSTDWDEEASIGSKYLRLMRHIIKLPNQKDIETREKFIHYQLLSIVLNKTLTNIITKMNKDI